MRELRQLLERAAHGGLEVGDGGGVILVRAAHRLGDDAVDQPHLQQIARGEFQRGGSLRRVLAVFPQNRRTPFRRDHGVVGVFQHEHAIRHGDAERAAAPAFTDDHGHGGCPQDHHLAQVHGDGLRDVPLLGAQAWIGTGGVDEGDKRQAEFFREAHQAERLAVALGVGAAKVPLEVLLQLAAFLVADDHALSPRDRRESAGHRAVLGKEPVAVQLDEIAERKLEVIERERPRIVPGDLHALPGRQVFVNGPLGFLDLALHPQDFVVEIDVVRTRVPFQVGELFLEFDDRFFKFQRLQFHGGFIRGSRGRRR